MIEDNKLKKDIFNILRGIEKMRCYRKFEKDLKQEILDIKNEINDSEFKITIIGEFSSGKSTFLNALIGKDVLPHGLKETTAAITYVHNVSLSDSKLNEIHIHFTDEKIPCKIYDLNKDKNLLLEYVTTMAKNRNVVRDISAVHIYVNFIDNNDKIVLIDTPGMNGLAEGHQDLTINEIKHSHASICLFPLKGIGASDLRFVKEVMQYQSSFFFVINSIDELKASEGETYEKRLAAFKEEVKKNIYESKQNPEYVFGISALKALVAKDMNIDRLYSGSKAIEDKEERNILWEESKMGILIDSLNNYIKNGDKERNFYKSILVHIDTILNGLKQESSTDQKIYQAKVEDLPEKKAVQEVLQNLETQINNYKKHRASKLGSLMSSMHKELTSLARKLCENEHDILRTEINNLTFDEAIRFRDQSSLKNRLGEFWRTSTNRILHELRGNVDDIFDDMLLDMKNYLPSINFSQNKRITISISNRVENTGYDDNDKLSNLKREKELLEKKLSCIDIQESSSKLESQIQQLESDIQSANRSRQSAISSLGYRPEVKHWTETRTRKQGGVLGRIKRILTFGSCGYEEYTVEHIDDSAQRRYDAEKDRIENDYLSKKKSLELQKSALCDMLEDTLDEEFLQRQLKEKIQRKQDEIQREQVYRKKLEQEAKTSYLKDLKKGWMKDIDTYLSITGQVVFYPDMCASIREAVNSSEKDILNDIESIYTEKIKQYRERCNAILSKIDKQNDTANNVENLKSIQQDIKDIDILKKQIINLTNGL